MRAALALAALLAFPALAAADWLVTPFVGTTLGGKTNLLILDPSAGSKKFTFGGSFALLTDGLLGLEFDTSHVPHFFEGSAGSLVLTSGVSTVSGSLIVAVPQAITGYSLRPYAVGGIGLLHAASRDVLQEFVVDSNLMGLSIGGGAIGMVSNRSGLRFELRHFRNVTPDDSNTTTAGSTRISFWRASVGVVFRY